ncbi:MAG: zinc ribbon domain-containing protein [bacterium]|nr:zinc ribbon domain-containing protein [bacterium]
MPMYEFKCDKCNHVFEELLTSNELQKEIPECPECGSKKTKKQVSSFSPGFDSGGCGPSRSSFG